MYNKFRELFYRNASIAFTITGTSLLVIHYTLATNVQESMAFNLWLVFFAGIQIVGGFIFGTYVQKLYATANTDFLTGLNNVQVFYRELDAQFENASKLDHDVSLIMMDLDKFKPINDTYGHLVGDKILKHAADLFRLNTRDGDTLARIGGEEFAIILPNTGLIKATEIAEKIRFDLQMYQFPEVNKRLTISIGVTTFTKGMTKQEFIKLADDAMYRAKNKRNTVVSIVK